MGCCGRKTLWSLGFMLLLGTSSAQDTWEALLPSGLVEKSRAEEGSPTGPRQPRADRCPPPPRTLPPGACQATRCQADSECPRHRRCCYNGCAYACLEAVPPPPVLDWLVQPKPRWLGGNGWLLDGPEEVLQAEACSTTEDGAEPLLCPSGYECHILRPGDPAQGIPNHGQCVKQRRQAEGRILRQKLHKQYPAFEDPSYAFQMLSLGNGKRIRPSTSCPVPQNRTPELPGTPNPSVTQPGVATWGKPPTSSGSLPGTLVT